MRHHAPLIAGVVLVAGSAAVLHARAPLTQQQRIGGSANAPNLTRAEVKIDTVGHVRAAVSGRTFHLEVEVDGQASNPVDLVLLNPQPGMVFEPVRNQQLPFRGSLRWTVPSPDVVGDEVTLIFQARTAAPASGPGSATGGVLTFEAKVPIEVSLDAGAAILTGDVNGDGVLDVVAGARFGDSSGTPNAGQIYVWLGSSTPTGDPDATLRVSSAAAGDALGDGAGPAIQLVDVTDDGIVDVVAAARSADTLTGIANAGAIYVWKGGPTIFGELDPDATLAATSPTENDMLGDLPVHIGDVTGDEVPDIVAGSSFADANGIVNSGALWVWEGGSTLSGLAPPLTQLQVSTASPGDQLGMSDGQSVQLVDMNGDEILDILVGARLADAGGFVNSGAAYLWFGGTLFGPTSDPDVTYDRSTEPFVRAGDMLGRADGQAIVVADITGDGRQDVLIGASRADEEGIVNSGAVYVWAGTEFPESNPQVSATLYDPLATANQGMCRGSGATIQVGEMTGDTILDVVVTASTADEGRGQAYVFEGSSFLSGPVTPLSTLVHDGGRDAAMGDASGQAVVLADISGDGFLDIVAAAPFADDITSARTDVGALYYWSGDFSQQAGIVGPTASLTAEGESGDRLGIFSGPSITIADVTGDNQIDILTGASNADRLGITDAGAFYVWAGGGPFLQSTPDATLADPFALDRDRLGRSGGLALRLCDVTGDDELDVVITASFADANGVIDAGAVQVFQGGPLLTGEIAPWVTLTNGVASDGDRLGDTGGRGVLFADVSGDGLRDIVVGARYFDHLGVADAGAVMVWESGPELEFQGFVPTWTLASPSPSANDQLSFASVSITAADVTDNGETDLLIGAQNADLTVENQGAIFLWKGGTAISGNATPAPTVLSNSVAAAGDTLGG